VPYLTPQELPEGDDCRPLSIPANAEWLAIFGGALTELTKTWNWEDSGGLSIADTIAEMNAIIENWYEQPCTDFCALPEGTPIFRIGEDGHIEQLSNGEWVTPFGDWAIPPTEPRTEPTEQERICLAAANAENVLHLLYEDLSDSLGSALDAVEAAAHTVAFIGGGIGLLLGLISGGMIEMAGFIYASVYAAVEFITADLWDTEFTNKLICILVNCATEEDDVVHFDYECVMAELRDSTTILDPTLTDLRLLGQLSAILPWIGSEGLDAAGATTDIEDHSCDDCSVCPDIADEMVSTLADYTQLGDSDAGNIYLLPTTPGTLGDYQSSGGAGVGQGYVKSVTYSGTGSQRVVLVVELNDVCNFEGASIKWYHSAFGVSTNFIAVYDAAGDFLDYSESDSISAVDEWVDLDWTSGTVPDVKYIQFFLDVTSDTYGGLGAYTIFLNAP